MARFVMLRPPSTEKIGGDLFSFKEKQDEEELHEVHR
jgi:hypothetical protein